MDGHALNVVRGSDAEPGLATRRRVQVVQSYRTTCTMACLDYLNGMWDGVWETTTCAYGQLAASRHLAGELLTRAG